MSKSHTNVASTRAPDQARATARRPTVVIRPTKGWAALNLRDLWNYRDLLFILAGRDVKLRYKQTALGVVWIVLQPLVAALLFAVIFGSFARLPSNGMPYILMAFTGLIPWLASTNALQRTSTSLVSNAGMISKVYFPRLLVPLSIMLASLIDLVVMLLILVVLMFIYHIPPTWRLLTLPGFILLMLLVTVGVGLWLAALSVQYRDVVHTLPSFLRISMFASPVVYPTTIVPEQWRTLYSLNPLVGIIEGFRWSILEQHNLTPAMLLFTTASALLLAISGIFFFRRVERSFADVI